MNLFKHTITWLCAFALFFALTGCTTTTEPPATHTVKKHPPTQVINLLMQTELGDIVLTLFPTKAPLTVANFMRYVDAGLYNGASFYRTVSPKNDNNPLPISVIQGGINPKLAKDFTAPFPPIAHESTERTSLIHTDGAISMARFKPGSAASEFFISIGSNPVLDAGGKRNPDLLGFAVFGKVKTGMQVINTIHQQATKSSANDAYVKGQVLAKPVSIIAISRL